MSLTGFAARGMPNLADPPLLQTRFVRIAPRVVDSVLPASALFLASFLAQYPSAHGWFAAKVLALLPGTHRA